MQTQVRQDQRSLQHVSGVGADRELQRELERMVTAVCQRNSPENWRDEAMDSIGEVNESIERGEFTVDDWIKALS